MKIRNNVFYKILLKLRLKLQKRGNLVCKVHQKLSLCMNEFEVKRKSFSKQLARSKFFLVIQAT
jgi:hypothetical protein